MSLFAIMKALDDGARRVGNGLAWHFDLDHRMGGWNEFSHPVPRPRNRWDW